MSGLSCKYHDMCAFENTKDTDYRQVLRKLSSFVNLHQFLDAARNGDLERVKYLLQRDRVVDIEIDGQNWLGRTALHESILNNQEKTAKYLVRKGHASARIADKDGNTALHFAVINRSLPMVQLLLEVDTNINAKNSDSMPSSPLDLAEKLRKMKLENEIPQFGQMKSQEEMIHWLLSHRPFLMPSKASKFVSKVQNHPSTISPDAINACKSHVITAVEFYEDKKTVIDRKSVQEMLYSSEGDPDQTLKQALEMAVKSERMLEEMAGNKSNTLGSHTLGEAMAGGGPPPVSLCRWFHIPANNVTTPKIHFMYKLLILVLSLDGVGSGL